MSLFDDVRDFVAPSVSFKTVDNFYCLIVFVIAARFFQCDSSGKPPEERTEADYTVNVVRE